MLKYIIILFAVLVGGCSPLSIITKPIDKTPLNMLDPSTVNMLPVHFIVITKENSGAVWDELEKAGVEPVLFALTGSDYKALAVNVDTIKNYILIEKDILGKYREYYEPKPAK